MEQKNIPNRPTGCEITLEELYTDERRKEILEERYEIIKRCALHLKASDFFRLCMSLELIQRELRDSILQPNVYWDIAEKVYMEQREKIEHSIAEMTRRGKATFAAVAQARKALKRIEAEKEGTGNGNG